jgi:hypothetical protein
MLLAKQNGTTSCCLNSSTTRCVQNMKKEMAIHRYKIQITRFKHEVFIVIKRELTRYKIGGKFKYSGIRLMGSRLIGSFG